MLTVIKRDGRKVNFDKEKIQQAVHKAFIAVDGALTPYAEEKAVNIADYIEKYGYIFTDFESKFNAALSVTELMSKDGKTSLNLTGYTNQEKVTIFAAAINDQNQFVIKAQEVAINNTNESVAPIISKVSLHSCRHFSEVCGAEPEHRHKGKRHFYFLPCCITFTDAIDKSLQVDIKCYVDDVDQVVGVTIDEFIQKTTGECGIKTAKLTTTYAGTYYVVYTATDDAGNTISYVSTFEVANIPKRKLGTPYDFDILFITTRLLYCSRISSLKKVGCSTEKSIKLSSRTNNIFRC